MRRFREIRSVTFLRFPHGDLSPRDHERAPFRDGLTYSVPPFRDSKAIFFYDHLPYRPFYRVDGPPYDRLYDRLEVCRGDLPGDCRTDLPECPRVDFREGRPLFWFASAKVSCF